MKKKKSLTGLIITLMVGWVFLMDQRDYSDREYLTTISFIVRSSSMEFRMMKKLDNFKRNCLVRGGGSKHAAACDPLRVAPYVSEIMQIMPVLEGAHPGFEDVLIQELEKNNHDGVKDLRVMALKLYVENLEDVRAKYKRRTAVLHAAFFAAWLDGNV